MVAAPTSTPGSDRRARTRAMVASVALRLFVSRGFDQVTVDDIVAEAGISRRTFFRYFTSKEDAAIPDEHGHLEQFAALLAERPADEPLLVSIRRAARVIASTAPLDRDELLARLRLVQETPSIRAYRLEVRSHWESLVRDIVAEHLGEDPPTSLTATVVAVAAVGAARAAGEVWLANEGAGDPAELIGEAFDVLVGGLVGEQFPGTDGPGRLRWRD